MNQPTAVKDDSARSPFAGCAILIAALAVMVFLIGFSVLTLFRQFNEIAKFTDDKPVAIEISSLENKEPELNDLAERIEAFRQQLAGDDRSLARPIRRRFESRDRRLRRLQGTARHLPRHRHRGRKAAHRDFISAQRQAAIRPRWRTRLDRLRLSASSTAPWSPARTC